MESSRPINIVAVGNCFAVDVGRMGIDVETLLAPGGRKLSEWGSQYAINFVI